MNDSLAILDYGSQYTQLIARRVRESQVYCELFPWDTPRSQVLELNPKGFILSGGPASVYQPGAPTIPSYVLESGLPILGICYGMQLLTHTLGGRVDASAEKEYGHAQLETLVSNPLITTGVQAVWMSHGDRIVSLPEGFVTLGGSKNSPIAFMGDLTRRYFGLQFHPEVHHTPNGGEILSRFAREVCLASPDWTPDSIIEQTADRVRRQIGQEPVIAAVSGGVDSSVASAMVQKAVGNQLVCIFVDTGLLRHGEAEQVQTSLHDRLGMELITVDASDRFLSALRGETEPEKKRLIIGEMFIRTFEEQALQLGSPRFLVQGTIYPDVVESSASDRGKANRIKTHHNVGGLPQNMGFELVEPLRYLFKDEVRAVGNILGLPAETLQRQPFPGPGLAVRCIGEITTERIQRLRAADRIFISELSASGMLQWINEDEKGHGTSQAFAILLPVRSVGVMGDQRTYLETVALRAVTTQDFMTADWARLPHNLLARVANRIVNEVDGVNRVVYDITSKPPGTIEWE